METGLDLFLFQECLDSERPSACIANEIECCEELGITATPTYVCDGRTVVGAISEDDLAKMIEESRVDRE